MPMVLLPRNSIARENPSDNSERGCQISRSYLRRFVTAAASTMRNQNAKHDQCATGLDAAIRSAVSLGLPCMPFSFMRFPCMPFPFMRFPFMPFPCMRLPFSEVFGVIGNLGGRVRQYCLLRSAILLSSNG